ncbi:hypothetical protein C8Q79DRAFT_938190 [Trametes meyenii]|nr:hypothetical protein C8Q79DRAFT_938190 [Trametes meyenii]
MVEFVLVLSLVHFPLDSIAASCNMVSFHPDALFWMKFFCKLLDVFAQWVRFLMEPFKSLTSYLHICARMHADDVISPRSHGVGTLGHHVLVS